MTGSTRYEIEHVSRYRYTLPARQSVMSLCLRPRDGEGQQLLSFEIETDPPTSFNSEVDSFGNTKYVLNIHREHLELDIAARSVVDVAPIASISDSLGPDAWEEIHSRGNSIENWNFTHPSVFARPSASLNAFMKRTGVEPGSDPLKTLRRLSDTLHQSFQYAPGSTSAASPIEHVLESGRGVCQDYTHVMIAIARSWGVPSRYVSGYIYVARPEGEQALQSAHHTHAWVECLLPGAGWIGFDPTNGSLADDRHVRIALGRDYHDVSPTRGIRRGGGDSSLEVEVRMQVRPSRTFGILRA